MAAQQLQQTIKHIRCDPALAEGLLRRVASLLQLLAEDTPSLKQAGKGAIHMAGLLATSSHASPWYGCSSFFLKKVVKSADLT